MATKLPNADDIFFTARKRRSSGGPWLIFERGYVRLAFHTLYLDTDSSISCTIITS